MSSQLSDFKTTIERLKKEEMGVAGLIFIDRIWIEALEEAAAAES